MGYFIPPSGLIKIPLSLDRVVTEKADGSVGFIFLGQENDDKHYRKPALPDDGVAAPASKATSPSAEGILISGIKFEGTGSLPASAVQTFVSTLAITDALVAGLHVQLTPHQATEGVSLNYKPVKYLMITTNLDRRIVGTDIGSSSQGLGLGLESSDPTSFDMGIQAEFIVHFGGGAAR